MRRISLALALIGAVAATGCGQTSTSNTGGNRGVTEGTFNVTIQNGQNGNTSLAIVGGYVTSTPVGLDCGQGHSVCSFDFPAGTQVTLTAVPLSGFNFWSFAGDCFTAANTCKVTSVATDQYVLARFGAIGATPPGGHPNWDPTLSAGSVVHSTQVTTLLSSVPFADSSAWRCADCHGSGLAGAGLAPACNKCHFKGSAVVVAPATTAVGETCSNCHLNQGAIHQATYNKYTDGTATGGTILAATIDSIVSSQLGSTSQYIYTAKFTVLKNGQPYAGDVTKFAQKTIYVTQYSSAARDFVYSTSLSKISADTGTGKWKASNSNVANPPNNTNLGQFPIHATTAAPYLSDGFAYAYFAENPRLIPPVGHYSLYDNVASAALQFNVGTAWSYGSYANVTACQGCHGTPYMKHGYRAAVVPGIQDFVACKACHFDWRPGTDFDWQVLRNEPATLAALTASGTVSADWTTDVGATGGLLTANKYPYVATVMNDTHMSHAMEFPYPQSMANCATCHAGKFGTPQGNGIFADAFFTAEVCKSCHATTAGAPDEAGRAPLLAPDHHEINWITGKLVHRAPATPPAIGAIDGYYDCTYCHSDAAKDTVDGGYPTTNMPQFYVSGDAKFNDGVGPCFVFGPFPCVKVPLLKDLHNGGYDAIIYASAGTKYQTTVTSAIAASAVDATGLTLTFTASVPAATTSWVAPTVVVSLYGYDTKDFLVSGHSSQSDGTTNLEWTEGATQRSNPSKSSNSTRLTVTPNGAVGNVTWTIKANLGLWASQIQSGAIKRIEIGFLPAMGKDPSKKPDNTSTSATYNPFVAIGGTVAAFQLNGASLPTVVSEKVIADTNKCNSCHDRLATTFHGPNYGSAGVVGCRLCHTPASGGSHLEMQGRSIDSYIHAIHAFQAFDIGNVTVWDFKDPTGVSQMEYNHHIEHTFPTFTLLSCEACHVSGQDPSVGDGRKFYDLPLNGESLPAILSASGNPNEARAISGVPSVVTGPSAKACGGCHRAFLINEDSAAGLEGYDSHTQAFGYRQVPGGAVPGATVTDVWSNVIKNVFGF